MYAFHLFICVWCLRMILGLVVTASKRKSRKYTKRWRRQSHHVWRRSWLKSQPKHQFAHTPIAPQAPSVPATTPPRHHNILSWRFCWTSAHLLTSVSQSRMDSGIGATMRLYWLQNLLCLLIVFAADFVVLLVLTSRECCRICCVCWLYLLQKSVVFADCICCRICCVCWLYLLRAEFAVFAGCICCRICCVCWLYLLGCPRTVLWYAHQMG